MQYNLSTLNIVSIAHWLGANVVLLAYYKVSKYVNEV